MKNSLIPMTANEQPQVAYPPMPAMDAQTEMRDA